MVGGAGGALGGSLGGSFGFFPAGAAALGACGAWGGAGGFCSVDGGVPGAFDAASGFLTSGVGVALFSGIEYTFMCPEMENASQIGTHWVVGSRA